MENADTLFHSRSSSGSRARAYAVEGHTVLAADLDENTLSFAMLSGAVHGKLDEKTIPKCSLILLAIYPGGCAQWLEENGKYISKETEYMPKPQGASASFTRCKSSMSSYLGGTRTMGAP